MTRLNRLAISLFRFALNGSRPQACLPQPISISSTAWHSAKWATSTNPYSFDRTKKLTSPLERRSLSSVKPEKVTTLQLRGARRLYGIEDIGERPELLMATRRSPARPWNSICLANTFS